MSRKTRLTIVKHHVLKEVFKLIQNQVVYSSTHKLRDPLRRDVCFRLTVAQTSKSENKNKHRSFLVSPPFY